MKAVISSLEHKTERYTTEDLEVFWEMWLTMLTRPGYPGRVQGDNRRPSMRHRNPSRRITPTRQCAYLRRHHHNDASDSGSQHLRDEHRPAKMGMRAVSSLHHPYLDHGACHRCMLILLRSRRWI